MVRVRIRLGFSLDIWLSQTRLRIPYFSSTPTFLYFDVHFYTACADVACDRWRITRARECVCVWKSVCKPFIFFEFFRALRKKAEKIGRKEKRRFIFLFPIHEKTRKNKAPVSQARLKLTIVSRGWGMVVWKLHCLSRWRSSHVIVLEKVFLVGERKFYGHVTAKDSQHVTMKDYTIIKSERCYWMTASLYRKYNTFSDRESEQVNFCGVSKPSPSTNYELTHAIPSTFTAIYVQAQTFVRVVSHLKRNVCVWRLSRFNQSDFKDLTVNSTRWKH